MTRRALLARGAAAGAGLLVVGCGGSAGAPVQRAVDADFVLLTDPIAVALSSAGQLRNGAREESGAGPRRLLRTLARNKREHARALQAALRDRGEPVPDGRGMVFAPPPERGGLATALALSRLTADLYVERLPRLRTPELRVVLGYVLAEEVEDAAMLRAALGDDPVTGAFR